MTASEFREYAQRHEALMQAQAVAIRDALAVSAPRVSAELPVDRVRSVELVYEDDRWRFARNVPLIEGSDDPVSSMGALAAALQSDAVADLLAMLSDDLRAQFVSEIAAITDALTEFEGSEVSVFGDSASVTIGEVTIRMVRQDGSWRVSAVEQPYVYDDYYYEEW